MYKRNLPLIFFFLLSLVSWAQKGSDDVYERQDYTWDDNPVIPRIDDKYKSADAVILNDYESVEIKFSTEKKLAKPITYNVTHKTIYISTDAGIELFNTVTVPLGKKEKLHSITARTVSAEGKITLLTLSNIKEVDNHDGTIDKIFALEGLQKKGMLEYVIKTYEHYDECYTFYMQSRVPLLHKQVEFIAPEFIRYNFKTYNGGIKNWETISEGKEKIRTLKDFDFYEAKEVPALAFEDYCNYQAQLLRVELQFAYNYNYFRTDVRDKEGDSDLKHRFMTHNDLAESIHRSYYEAKIKDPSPIVALSNQLALNVPTVEQHIRKIENYIKSTIQVSDEHDDDEFIPADILKNKTTGLDNIIRLYIELFKKSNITCQVALSCDKHKKAFDPDFDSYSFAHLPLLYFPQTNGYIDPLNLTLRYPLGDSRYLNNGVFAINLRTSKTDPFSDYFYLSDITEPDSIDRIETLDAQLSLSTDLDSVYINIKRTEPDYFAESMRSAIAFAPAAEKNKEVEETLRESMKDAVIENLKMTNNELLDADKPLVIEARLAGTALIEKSGHDRILKIGEVIGTQRNLYQETTRTNPINLDYKHKLVRKIELNIPSGYKVSGLDAIKKNAEFSYQNKKACGFNSSYQLTGNKLTVAVEEYYLQTDFPAKVYNDFRTVINTAADFNKVALVISK